MKLGRRSKRHSIFYAVITAVFLSVLFLSLVNASASMSVSEPTAGCPFMSHGEVLCSMGTLDHLAAWKSVFTAVTPSFVLLFMSFAAVAIILAVAPNRLLRRWYRVVRLSRDIRERIYTFAYRPFQELFSNGILHPKLF